MSKLITILLFLFPFTIQSQTLDVGLFGNVGAFGIVLDTFQAPLGPGFEGGVQVAFDDFMAHASFRRGIVGTKSQKSRYGLAQAGLGGTYEVFYFSLALDYMILDKRLEERTNIGAIGASLRFGVDIPVTDRIGLFGVANLGTNRLHTYAYFSGGVSYHFNWDTTTKSSFYTGE